MDIFPPKDAARDSHVLNGARFSNLRTEKWKTKEVTANLRKWFRYFPNFRLCIKICLVLILLLQVMTLWSDQRHKTSATSSLTTNPQNNNGGSDLAPKDNQIINNILFRSANEDPHLERNLFHKRENAQFHPAKPIRSLKVDYNNEIGEDNPVYSNLDSRIKENAGQRRMNVNSEDKLQEPVNNPRSADKQKRARQQNLSLQQKMPPVSRSLCPSTSPHLIGRMEFLTNVTPPSVMDIARSNPYLNRGGIYQPPSCTSRYRVAMIIPHRARETHLRSLLAHLHPLMQRQQLHYRIFVIHQNGNHSFNKAKLMNAGFLEAMKMDMFDCVIFHDVDLLPEDDRLIYSCTDSPKHLSVAIDKYDYKLPYTSLFGGVTVLTTDQFRDVNGFSNMYWGWGGEDDDMFTRIFSRGYSITRPPEELARYKMSLHHRDKGNKANPMRYEVLSTSVDRMQRDGLNSVAYRVISKELGPLFTNITLEVGSADVACKPYLTGWSCTIAMWLCEKFMLVCGTLTYNATDEEGLGRSFLELMDPIADDDLSQILR